MHKSIVPILIGLFVMVLLSAPLAAEAAWSTSTIFDVPLLCGDDGWTFPGLIWGDRPITMCMLWWPLGSWSMF